MVRNAVVSVLIGDRHNKIAELTHPTQMKYAHTHGADFLVYDSAEYKVFSPDGSTSTISSYNPVVPRDIGGLDRPAFGAYNKLNVVELLDHYDRVLHIDTDIIVRPDSPNLFEIVPYEKIGIVSESDFIPDWDRGGLMQEWADRHNISFTNWGKRYYNTGVFLFSQGHERMLDGSRDFYDDTFYEQTPINMNIHLNQIPVHELPPIFNRMSFMDYVIMKPRHDSYFIHYAGSWLMLRDGHNSNPNFLLKLIKHDLNKWNKNAPDYKYERIKNYVPRNFWVRD